ncbi:MAG: choice-of-anchor J domain-containing protein [Phaeodactylibacter sp.]|nr:choice-of-anchor J domain-containing protein [Phaeodactylibacter sp.]
MKKFLPIFLFSCLNLIGPLSGQVVLHEEAFDGSLGSWTSYNALGPQTWQAESYQDREYAYINGYSGGAIDNEDWLISPAVNLDEYDDEVLSFENAANFDGPDVQLVYALDYDGVSDPTATTWYSLSDQINLSPGDYEFVESEVDLSSIAGSSVHFAFVYQSSTGDGARSVEIDNFMVQAELSSSVKEISKSALISSPTVSQELLQFEILDPSKALTFGIYDMNGRSLQSRAVQPLTSDVKIPVGQFSTGMYLLVVRSENIVKTFKFVVSH